jgi:signal transduction histidine kinase
MLQSWSMRLSFKLSCAYAGSTAEARQVHDLKEFARSAADLVRRATALPSVHVECLGDADLVRLNGRASQLQQLAINLLLNAVQAESHGGHIRIAAHRDCRPFIRKGLKIGPSKYVCLVVDDEGTGMTPQVLERIFEPMFTTREAEHAVGLGLTAVAAIVEEHRGFVEVTSGPGLGTRVAVFLRADLSDA